MNDDDKAVALEAVARNIKQRRFKLLRVSTWLIYDVMTRLRWGYMCEVEGWPDDASIVDVNLAADSQSAIGVLVASASFDAVKKDDKVPELRLTARLFTPRCLPNGDLLFEAEACGKAKLDA